MYTLVGARGGGWFWRRILTDDGEGLGAAGRREGRRVGRDLAAEVAGQLVAHLAYRHLVLIRLARLRVIEYV